MLRRSPTAITVTAEDIAAYEERAARRANPDGTRPSGEKSHGSGVAAVVDPNDELKPLPADKSRGARSRNERIVGAGNAAGPQLMVDSFAKVDYNALILSLTPGL
ncbi:MAG: hypothetical protein M1825_000677 [Sarcosagium campestre]|nr:MAG: hypothetical protein M1825_000677 [Sarcosagium campestre]